MRITLQNTEIIIDKSFITDCNLTSQQRNNVQGKLMRPINAFCLTLPILFLSIPTLATAQNYCGVSLNGVYVEIEPFYVGSTEPLLSKTAYAITDSELVSPAPDFVLRHTLFHLDHENDWGYHLALGYDFPSCSPCKYGFSFEYNYFNNKEEGHTPHFTRPDGFSSAIIRNPLSVFNPEPQFPAAFGFSDAKEQLTTRYDAVDLLTHKNIQFCNGANLQFFTGARYLHFKENLEANYHFLPESAVLFLTTLDEQINFNNRFDGIGPRIGAKGFYPLFNCNFGLTVQVAGNLLMGKSKSSFYDNLTSDNIFDLPVPPAFEDVVTFKAVDRQDSTQHVVPSLDGKVGLMYTTTFCNRSSLAIEVGYRADRYFGLSDDTAFVESVTIAHSLIDTLNNFTEKDYLNNDAYHHDFDISGPYLNVTYRF